MRIIVWRAFLLAGGLALAGMTAGMAAQGSRTQQNEEVLGALLTEVRGLRAAIEEMASAGPRVQLVFGRLQLQEQRINTMLRRLESVRDSLSGAERGAAAVQDRVRMMETAVKGSAGPEAQELAHMVDVLKREAASAALEVQRLQAEETQLQQQIATEQGRWSEINQRLEELERALGRR